MRRISCSRGEQGQAALFMTLSLFVALGLIGLVVDEGWAYWRQEACLTAAQSAATAAAMYVKNNVSGTITCTTTIACQAATACTSAQSTTSPPTSDIGTACVYAKQNGFQASGKQNVTIEAELGNAPTVSGVTSAFYVTARVSESVPLTFLSVVARQTSAIVSASATAAIISQQAGSCIYVLDPTGSQALNANNDAFVEATCGIQVDSSSSTAATAVGSACVQTQSGSNRCTGGSSLPPIKVVGQSSANNNGAFWPAATNNSTSISDPLSGLEVPWCTGSGCPTTNCEYTGCADSSCDYTNVTISTYQSTPDTINPGVYCGTGGNPAIFVNNGSSVKFNPGMYVINGGGISITSGSSNSGAGVIFYLTGNNTSGASTNYSGFTISNGVSGITLTPPTSGGLAGVLFYQDRRITSTSVTTPPGNSCSGQVNMGSAVCGGSSSSLKGIVYLPGSTMWFTNGTSTAVGMSLVVKDVVFNGGSYLFNPDPYGTLVGSAGGNKAVLVGAQ